MMNPWLLIIFFLVGWISTLSGVYLGGWLVYRTKRETYEPLIGGPAKGDSFNVDDGFGQVQDVAVAEMPKPTSAANDLFVKQFAESMAFKGASSVSNVNGRYP